MTVRPLSCHERVKIVILGAGQVGGSVAHILASEANDVTVVDANAERLQALQDRLDLRTVPGHASHPSVLEQAGIADADMLIALTDNDEVNMIACQIAYTLFNTPTKIARVRAGSYIAYREQLFKDEALPIDVLISPEQLVTDYIQRIIEHPGALQVLDFADGQVRLVGVKAYEGSTLVGQALRTLPDRMPGIETRVAAIFRQGSPIIPEGNTLIEADDEVFLIAARKNTRAIVGELRKLDRMVKRIIIAGGGHIGARLAQGLEERFQVKVIEQSRNQQAIVRTVGPGHRAAGRRRRRKPAAAGKHRACRCVLRGHQRRRGQYPVGDAGQADGRPQGDGADQPGVLRGFGGVLRHH
jgi:trk system potassium uptake protein TrkA